MERYSWRQRRKQAKKNRRDERTNGVRFRGVCGQRKNGSLRPDLARDGRKKEANRSATGCRRSTSSLSWKVDHASPAPAGVRADRVKNAADYNAPSKKGAIAGLLFRCSLLALTSFPPFREGFFVGFVRCVGIGTRIRNTRIRTGTRTSSTEDEG